jgi:hypothetical protein
VVNVAAEATLLLASAVLSTFASPTIVFVIPLTVPVKVGEAIGAFNPMDVTTPSKVSFRYFVRLPSCRGCMFATPSDPPDTRSVTSIWYTPASQVEASVKFAIHVSLNYYKLNPNIYAV